MKSPAFAPDAAPAQVSIALGARHQLRAVLAAKAVNRVLVVASERTAGSGVVRAMLDRTTARFLVRFTAFTPNPRIEQTLAGSALRERWQPDIIVAIGGGSAIDTAKLLRSLPPQRDTALRVLAGDEAPVPHPVPLVAVPTTAGTGSEVTRFATVYVGDVKASLDHPTVLPEHAIVDPELLRTCPTTLMYSAAFDTLCHALESYWSRRSTASSRALALPALRQTIEILARDLEVVGDNERLALASAATAAGRAIDLTRTTAAHAFSYPLTAHFGVPHGVACLLNLLWLVDYNNERVAHRTRAATRVSTVRTALRRLDPRSAPAQAVRSLLVRAGLPDRLSDYGVRHTDVCHLVDAGLGSTRSGNNPAPLDHGAVQARISSLV
jgi:alcohol dehydrogenase class IV